MPGLGSADAAGKRHRGRGAVTRVAALRRYAHRTGGRSVRRPCQPFRHISDAGTGARCVTPQIGQLHGAPASGDRRRPCRLQLGHGHVAWPVRCGGRRGVSIARRRVGHLWRPNGHRQARRCGSGRAQSHERCGRRASSRGCQRTPSALRADERRGSERGRPAALAIDSRLARALDWIDTGQLDAVVRAALADMAVACTGRAA